MATTLLDLDTIESGGLGSGRHRLLYHMTDRKNLQNILKNGIQTRNDGSIQLHEGWDKTGDAVYAFDKKDQAVDTYFRLGALHKNPVVIAFKPHGEVSIDPEFEGDKYSSVIHKGTVPAKNIVSYYDLDKEGNMSRGHSISSSGTQDELPIQGHTTFQGLPISIENKAGSVRSGKEPNGDPWSIKMPYDYGYIDGTEGTDGDAVDCFIGPNKDSKWVYVIHQQQNKESDELPHKIYDEDKVMLGWDSAEEAAKAYDSAYNNVDLFTSMTIISMDEFKCKLDEMRGKKLHAQYEEILRAEFNPDESRDDHGRWTTGGTLSLSVPKLEPIPNTKSWEDRYTEGTYRIIDVANALADQIGFPKSKIVTDGNDLISEYGTELAHYSPGNGFITIRSNQFRNDMIEGNTDRLASTLSHEMMHDVFNQVIDKGVSQEYNTAWKAGDIAEDGNANISFVKNEDQYPMLSKLKDYIGGQGAKMLSKADGVTKYSAYYWDKVVNQVSGKKITQLSILSDPTNIAVNETLAEIASLRQQGEKDKVNYIWNDFFNKVVSLYKPAYAPQEVTASSAEVLDAHAKDNGTVVVLYKDGSSAIFQPFEETTPLLHAQYREALMKYISSGGEGSGRKKSVDKEIEDIKKKKWKNQTEEERRKVASKDPRQKSIDFDKLGAKLASNNKEELQSGGPGSGRHHVSEMTDAQWSYIRSLLKEAFVKHYEHGLGIDWHHRPERATKEDASVYINKLKDAKAKGWKKDLTAGGPGSGRKPYGKKAKPVSNDLQKHANQDALKERREKERAQRQALNKQGLSQRGKPILSERAQRALANSDRVATKKEQDIAENTENLVTKAVNGTKSHNNSPFDVVTKIGNKNIGIEVKTLINQKNDKITQKADAINRKIGYAKANKINKILTVAVDYRGGKTEPDVYMREGVGSFRIGNMQKLQGGYAGLSKVLGSV